MARAPSFKKISFRTTKAEEAYLESLNQTSYHAASNTEFMHRFMKDCMSVGTASSGLTGNRQASGVVDKNDAMTEAAILEEMCRLSNTSDPVEVVNCVKRIRELETAQETAQKAKQDASKAPPYDPNACSKRMVEHTKLMAEFVDNCAKIRKGMRA